MYRFIIITFLFVGFLVGSSSAFARTVSCSTSGTVNPTTSSSAYYDPQADVCTIRDGAFGGAKAYELFITTGPTAGGFWIQGWADVNGTKALSLKGNAGCQVGGSTFPATSNCSKNGLATGTYTNILKNKDANGEVMTMTVVIDVVANTSATIKSAKVVVGDEDTGAGDGSQKPDIQGAVSKSQTKVIATNVGARFDAIGGDVGAVGRNTPTGGDVLDQAKQNFALNSPAESWNTSVRHSRGVASEDAAREMAMMASFDSSSLMLGAAQKGKPDGVLAPQEREALLAERPLTVWGHGAYTNLDNDHLSGDEDNRYDGDVWGYNIGVDYRFSEKFYAGVSLGYSETDLTTTYNNGEYDETSWSLSPYAVYKPIEPLKLSFLGGYSMGDLDLSRNNGAVTGDTDSDMWFMGLNADYTIQPSKSIPLDVIGSVGFLAAHKTVDAYQESDGTNVAKEISNTRQVKSGVEVAYTFDAKGTSIQPFTKVDFLYDFKDATNDDAFAFDIGGGLRLGNAQTGLSGSIEGETQLGRDDYKQYSISGMVAYGFSLGANGDTDASQIKPFVKTGYTDDTQQYGTGVSFVHGSGLFEADVDLSHGLSTDAETRETQAKVGAKLRF